MAKTDATVFVLDDDALVRDAIGDLLHSAGLDVCLFAAPGELMQRIDEAACLILDVYLVGANGLDVQQSLACAEIDIPIIFLSGRADIPISVRAMKAGAVEFLTKPFRDQDLLDAVLQALICYSTKRLQRKELFLLRERFATLSPREKEVMTLIVTGMLNKEVAAALGTQVITVKIQRSQVMRKMAANSFADLVRMAQRLGMPSDYKSQNSEEQ
jgi:FixJ family two-component response regulator